MFNQLRNAVEQLAQPIREVALHEDHSEPPARSGSLDIQSGRSASLSSGDLAESAISSLRKSFASQRTLSSPSPKPTSPPAPVENTRPRKSNLEERLRRATYAIGDVSGSTTPGTGPASRSSRVGSPSPMGADRNTAPLIVQEPAHVSAPFVAQTTTASSLKEETVTTQPSVPTSSNMTQALEKSEEDVKPNPKHSAALSDLHAEKVKLEEDAKAESLSTVTATENDAPPDKKSGQHQEPSPSIASAPILSPDVTPAVDLIIDETSVTAVEAGDLVEDVNSNPPNDEPVVEENLTLKSQNDEPASEHTKPVLPSQYSDDGPLTTTDGDVVRDNDESHAGTTNNLSKEGDLPMQQDIPDDVCSDTEGDESDASTSPAADSLNEMNTIAIPEFSNPTQQVSLQVSETDAEQKAPPTEILALVEKHDNTAELEGLQARLKQVEQRFSDVSISFKRLQAEKLAADAVLREATPLESIKDADGLREFFAQIKSKEHVFQDEIKRLNQKLEVQEDRIEELRETHRLEAQSRSAEADKLKTQLAETEALFQAAQRATSNVEGVAEKHKTEIGQLQADLEKAKTTAKEEEEKRVKAISLLKTVRTKLVKAEKDKDDALREVASIKEKEQGDKNREQTDKQNFQREIDTLKVTHEQAIASLKAQFNKDYASVQDRYKQEIGALRGQSELDLASVKSNFTKDLSLKASQITTLENSLNNVTRDKNEFFDQLQLRQAEVESAQAHLESIQHQNTELQFQLREANDRVALLKEECSELLREQEMRSRDSGPSPEEIARMVSATEAKYEAKLAEMRRNLSIIEKERHDSESDWSRKLKEKVKELDDLKRILGSAAKTREADENVVINLKAEIAQAQQTVKNLERQNSELPVLRDQLSELDKTLAQQEKEFNVKIVVLEKQLEELKGREAQLKQSNKVLRDEMRKVQSSAALLERQRNPGVGYWTMRDGNGSATVAEPRTSNASLPETPTRSASPAPSVTGSSRNEEEVNLEYLRNVILQFLEHKEMRPNLVKVLSVILHFTPQETRRLIAKV